VLGDTRLRSDPVHANAGGYRQFAEGLAQRLRGLGLPAR
jgi:acyl-CoA hydrolase